jgi:hypothetical protein
MLQHMFHTDCLSREDGGPVVADLKQHPQYKLVHDTLKAKVHSKKGESPTNGADPHDGTIEDTMTQDQYLQMARTMLGSADRDDARDLAVMLWMMMCAGRGDDACLIFLPDLMAPKILKGIGRQDTEGWQKAVHWLHPPSPARHYAPLVACGSIHRRK